MTDWTGWSRLAPLTPFTHLPLPSSAFLASLTGKLADPELCGSVTVCHTPRHQSHPTSSCTCCPVLHTLSWPTLPSSCSCPLWGLPGLGASSCGTGFRQWKRNKVQNRLKVLQCTKMPFCTVLLHHMGLPKREGGEWKPKTAFPPFFTAQTNPSPNQEVFAKKSPFAGV